MSSSGGNSNTGSGGGGEKPPHGSASDRRSKSPTRSVSGNLRAARPKRSAIRPGSSSIPTAASGRNVPGRSKSMEGEKRGVSFRRTIKSTHSGDGMSRPVAMEGDDSQPRQASSRFNRKGFATAANTTITTQSREATTMPSRRAGRRVSLDLHDVSSGATSTANAGAGGDMDVSIQFGTGRSDRAPPTPEGSNASLGMGSSYTGASASASASGSGSKDKNAATAMRFLDDDDGDEEADDGFDMEAKPTAPAMNKSVADFHMSQLNFPTITGGMYDDSSEGRSDPPLRFMKQSQTTIPETNVFATRQDLREVDQSVNLMSHDDAVYDSGRNKKNRRGNGKTAKTKRQSMVDVFLGDMPRFGPTHSGDNDFKAAKAKYLTNKEGCWQRFKNAIAFVAKILCSLPVLIFLAILAAGLIGIPLLLQHLDNTGTASSVSSNNLRTTAPKETTRAPRPVTTPRPTTAPAPVPVPAPAPDTTSTDATSTDTNFATPLFPAQEVEQRVNEVEDFVAKAGLDVDLSVPSIKEAITWLAAYDPAMLVLSESEVVQRVAVAAMYFATHPRSFANTTTIAPRQAGRQLSSSNYHTWMTQDHVCHWQGLECEQDRLVHLNMSHHNLMGTLPESLTLLTDLVELDLSRNQLHGSLPAEWTTAFPKLKYLFLFKNKVEGELPESIGEHWGETLYHLDLSENMLSGSLPTSIGQLSETRLLFLHENKFSGEIPVELGNLPNIEYLYLGNNGFSGEVPMDLLSKISTVVDLRLNDNDLTGTLPPEIESLHRLEFLSLAKNAMHGELPDVWDRLHYLVDLDLRNNQFDGSLPATLGKATLLEHLMLEENKISGTIPELWLTLTKLESLSLHHNNLEGPIPQIISDMESLKDLHLNHNGLTGSIPLQLGQLQRLVNVSFSDTEITGSLPSSFQDLYNLESLRVYNTQLTGEIPAEVCLLKYEHKLEYISADCVSEFNCECCDECF